MFLFKLILAICGAKISKLLGEHPGSGFIVGLFFGHFLDVIANRKFNEWKYKNHYLKKAKAKAEVVFRETFYTLAGKVCLADGQITEMELKKLEEISIDRLKVKKRDFKAIKKIFLSAGSSKIPIQSLGIKLVEIFQGDPNSVKNVLYTLKELALVDGGLNSAEYKSLFTVSSVFGFTPDEIQNILGSVTTQQSSSQSKAHQGSTNGTKTPVVKTILVQKLEILGCKETDNNEQIRRKYREMVSKFHPDKVSSKDLPQDFIDFAEKKFTEIHQAYEYIRKEKKF